MVVSSTSPGVDDTTYIQDSVSYHVQYDYVYRVAPELRVVNFDGEEFLGEEYIVIADEITNVLIDTVFFDGSLFPVFRSDKNYVLWLIANERYENRDSVSADEVGAIDLVPITDGDILINNNLAVKTTAQLKFEENLPGIIRY